MQWLGRVSFALSVLMGYFLKYCGAFLHSTENKTFFSLCVFLSLQRNEERNPTGKRTEPLCVYLINACDSWFPWRPVTTLFLSLPQVNLLKKRGTVITV